MLEFVSDRIRMVGALGLLLLLPLGAGAQLRTVVSSEVAVSGTEATLRLEFEESQAFVVAFQDGHVLVNGEAVGEYVRGDALESAWRSLLGEAISLGDGPLARALTEWAPPQGLTGASAETAALIDRSLDQALASPQEVVEAESGGEISLTLGGGEEGTLLGALLLRTGALEQLAEALEGLSLEQAGIRVGEEVVVEAGEELDGTLIVVDGDLTVRGLIRGDVVLAQGSVLLEEGGRIAGDLRVADGNVEWLGGSVDGSLTELGEGQTRAPVTELPDLAELRAELEKQVREEYRAKAGDGREHRGGSGVFSVFSSLGRGLAGLMENLFTFFILVVLGILTVHFAGDNLEIVATTARKAPARSAIVGLAGGFLMVPVWILGIVALAISIIGIPVLLVWVPVFPIAAALAGLFGYFAVAKNVGEWVAEQEYRGLEWIRGSNAIYVMVAGVGALMIPCVASNLIGILGLGFLKGVLAFVGSMVTFVVGAIGLGAVLLTRGGRIRPYAAYYEFEEGVWGEEPYPDADQPDVPDTAVEADAEVETDDTDSTDAIDVDPEPHTEQQDGSDADAEHEDEDHV